MALPPLRGSKHKNEKLCLQYFSSYSTLFFKNIKIRGKLQGKYSSLPISPCLC